MDKINDIFLLTFLLPYRRLLFLFFFLSVVAPLPLGHLCYFEPALQDLAESGSSIHW